MLYRIFKNFHDKYSKNLNNLSKFNDIKGPFSELNNLDLSIDNIKSSETVALLVYLKKE